MKRLTREDVQNKDWSQDELASIVLTLLFDLRDALAPPVPVVGPVDREKYPVDMGPGTVDFCTEKAALIKFEREDLGELFVPFSRMPPGAKEACMAENPFDEFFVGKWIYDRLCKKADENGNDHPSTCGGHDPLADEVPY